MNGLDVIAGTVRGDLGSSLRLALREERWFVVDLLGGVAGYAIWVAGTAALGLQVSTLAEYRVAPPGEPPTWPVLAVVLLLWIGLPAVAGAAHLRARVMNIRGNIDSVYRVDRPGMLLAAPVSILLVLALGTLVASGPVAPILAAALVPATVYLLVRTLAYSYRVFAFSHPLAVHLATFLTLAVQASVGLAYLGLANGQRALVQGATDRLGMGMIFSNVDLVFTSAPYLITMAVFVPVSFASAYVILQRVAVFLARRQDGSVSTTALRTGQRYPPWWEGEPAGLTTSRGAAHGGTTSGHASTGDASATSGSGANAADGAGASVTNGGIASAPESAADDDTAGSTSSESTADDADDESIDSPVEPASNTRVYTPPKEELDAVHEPGTGTESDGETASETDDGSTAVDHGDDGDDVDVAEASTDVVEGDTTCWSCGATVPADSDASYCPQCGEQIV